MSKFKIGCEVVCEDSDEMAEKFTLKEKLNKGKWVVSDHKGLLRVIFENNMFKLSRKELKIGDYAYNPFSDCIIYIDEEDDICYVNGSYSKVQNYKRPKFKITQG
jgi:hypothetical protein